MTRSISTPVDSPASSSLSNYEQGVWSARAFLSAMFRRAAAANSPATSAADTPEHSDQQR